MMAWNYNRPLEAVRIDSGSNFEGKSQCPNSLNVSYEKKRRVKETPRLSMD